MPRKLVLVYCSIALALFLRCESKIIRGTVSSKQAWQDKGQFVTKFCYHDQKASFKFWSNATSKGKWNFFLDEAWPYAYAEQDCAKKLAMTRFSVRLEKTHGQQYVNQKVRQHFWYIVYSDPYTCEPSGPSADEVIEYEMEFLNPDSSGNAVDHFGDNLSGLLKFYTALILIYICGVALYAHRVYLTITKGGPMHEVLKMLSVAMGLHFIAAILMLVHLWRYSVNGEGFTLLETLSEAAEMLAQCQMIWMLLSMSVGWTLGSTMGHPIRDKKQLWTIITVALVHVVLVLWEQSYDESHYTYHVHESLPGYLMVLLRICLAVLFGYNLRNTQAEERSVLRKDFYHSFAIGCYMWFLSLPLLIFISMLFAAYLRHKIVTVGVTVIQTSAMALLSRLFLTRSLYWEVSTLSSSTLPLRRNRGGGPGFLTRLS